MGHVSKRSTWVSCWTPVSMDRVHQCRFTLPRLTGVVMTGHVHGRQVSSVNTALQHAFRKSCPCSRAVVNKTVQDNAFSAHSVNMIALLTSECSHYPWTRPVDKGVQDDTGVQRAVPMARRPVNMASVYRPYVADSTPPDENEIILWDWESAPQIT